MTIPLNEVNSLLDEIDNDRSTRPLPKCYFAGDKEHNHPKGSCMYCDWILNNKGKDWCDPDFVEAWDFFDNYHRQVSGLT